MKTNTIPDYGRFGSQADAAFDAAFAAEVAASQQPPPHRFVRDSEDADVWVCELDPHEVGQWTPFGRHRSKSMALQLALKAWHAYDDAP